MLDNSLIARRILIVIGLLFSIIVNGQQFNLPLNHEIRLYNEGVILDNEQSAPHHSSFQPQLISAMPKYSGNPLSYYTDSATRETFLNPEVSNDRSFVYRKAFAHDLVIIDTGELFITINPLFNLSYGRNQSTGRSFYNNTRGLLLRTSIGKKFSFESYFYENQSRFPEYIQKSVNDRGVVPGQGRVKNFKDTSAFDYAMAGAYVSYTPSKVFNVQIGHDKHFIGDGYRSLMLSDNGFNYPFLRLNAWMFKDRMQYTVLYSSLQHLERIPGSPLTENIFQRKSGTFHYLNYMISKKLHVGLFQGMIWKTMDSTGRTISNGNLYNPVIFVNSAIYGLDDENNAILGLNMKYIPAKKVVLYGQMVVDDNQMKRYAYQLGGKFHLRRNVNLQIEHNRVASGTYSSTDNPVQSFSHYGQELTHPLGAGFREYIGRINLRYGRFIFEYTSNITVFESKGQNVFATESDVEYGREALLFNSVQFSILVNPATNMKLSLGYTNRSESVTNSINTGEYFFFGFHTDLRNLYYDF